MNVQHRLRAALRKRDIPCLLVSQPDNITYLLGCSKTEGYYIATQEGSFYLTDGRYLAEVRRKLKQDISVVPIEKDFLYSFKRFLKKHAIRKFGIESKSLSLHFFDRLRGYLSEGHSFDIVPTTDIVESLRAVKDTAEIGHIRQATRLTLDCFEYAHSLLASHHFSERSLSVEIERYLKLKGDGLAFPPIVAFDRYSAEPHHDSSASGNPFRTVALIDMGGKVEGYCSDLTRVYIKDRIPAVRTIYDIVQKAKDLAIKKIKAGRKIADIDKAARNYIDSKGYGKYFCHSLGHGVGIQVHEAPSISSNNEGYLQERMVCTIEPAIYLPGRFGIRLEEIVVVTSKGVDVLSA